MSSIIENLQASRTRLTAAGAPFELVDADVGGIAMPAYRNAYRNLAELIASGRQYGEQEFMVYETERWSFNRFFAEVDALAAQLHAVLGVRAGDPVAIAMRNRPEWAVAFGAIASLGAVPVPLNSYGLRDELLSAMRITMPRVLLCDAERLARLDGDLAALDCKAVVVGLDSMPHSPSVFTWETMVVPGGAAPTVGQLDPDAPALMIFTSGSTGAAKAVVSSHHAVCQAHWNVNYIGAQTALTSPSIISKLMQRGRAPTTLCVVPLFHVSGLHAQLLVALTNGRRLVFMRRWDAARAIELIRAENITQFNGAPSMVMQLMAEPGFSDVAGGIGGLGFGGAGLPQRVIDDLRPWNTELMAGIGFGMTESNGVCSAASGELFNYKPHSSGVLSPIIEVRTAGPDGNFLAPGETGEICLRGVSVMQAYFGDPAATGEALREGWLYTGDVGYVDEEGFLYVIDRIKDVINRNGEKISAFEIESCLLGHPQILEAAVFAAPDELSGERVVAVVVPVSGASLEPGQVQAYVADQIAAYKVPAEVHMSASTLPRSATGKILKLALKSAYMT